MAKDTLKDSFRAFIKGKTILIADHSSTARSSVAASLMSLGADIAQIQTAPHFAAADEIMTHKKPEIVLCDYDLGPRCGLDLLQRQRQAFPDSANRLFILVTSNTSQTAVARAAEEDVDTFLIKPFTAEVLRNSILKAALMKIKPPEYLQKIQSAKKMIQDTQFDEALVELEAAKKLDKAPALALGYMGQIQFMKEALESAEGSYQTGLSYNKIHYKCMAGLFDLMVKAGRHHDAYAISKKMSQYFPANPQRLSSVLRLAIQTKNYDDIERYYQIFINIDDRNEEIVKFVCAALVVCGKYYLSRQLRSRAIELFRKAAITGAGRPRILMEIIQSLVESGQGKDAAEFLERFPPAIQSTPDYLTAEIMVGYFTKTPAFVLEKGRALLQTGVKHALLFKTIMQVYADAGQVSGTEELHHLANQAFPKDKALWDEILARAKATQSTLKKSA